MKGAGVWLATAIACCAVQARATEQIFESRSAGGRVAYTDTPLTGSALLMVLPPARVRAGYVLEPTTGASKSMAKRAWVAAYPSDPVVQSLIAQAAVRYRLEVELLQALIRQESGFNPLAVSRAGARGLMQLMPATAKRYGVKTIHDPGENIAAGSAYLRDLLDRFGRLDLALAAYNAGEGAVEKYGNRIPPYDETQNYVASVLADYGWRKRQR